MLSVFFELFMENFINVSISNGMVHNRKKLSHFQIVDKNSSLVANV